LAEASLGWTTGLERTAVGRQLLAFDWSATPLGPLETWPSSLRGLVTMMLGCPTPMFLAWGPELTSFFNDAYLPVLGERADGALGKPFERLWGDIWDEIGPMVRTTLSGESLRVTDMKLDLRRGGVPEESWWSFSYSPAYDGEGRVAGLFCVTGETTPRILAERARDAADERLDLALSAGTSIGAWDWNVAEDRVVADARFALLYGVDPGLAAAGAPIAAFFGSIHPDDRPRVEASIAHAVETNGVFSEEYRLLDPSGRVRWVSAQGRCQPDEHGRCARFPGVSFDVTARVEAEQALRDAKEERDFVLALTARHRDTDGPDAVLRLSVDALGERLGAARCGFYRLLPGGRVVFGPCWSSGALPALLGEHSADCYGTRIRRARDTGQMLVFADARHDPEGGLDRVADGGVLAGILMPVPSTGRFGAGLFVNDVTVRAWTASEVALVREVAELTMLAVERSEATIRLRARVDQQQDALAQAAGELRSESAGRTAAETQLRQLQKMEAVGQLTGGIAHDFNNMLAVVIGGLNLLERRLARGDTDVSRYVEAAMEGATRAAALTQRLLAFSRQAPLSPEPLEPNRMVAGLTDLLARTLGEQVRLETVLGAGLWRAHADPNQLENVVVNLAVNARDAMPDGGRLTIETSNAHMDGAYAADEGIEPGQYVLIAVSDTGTGMAPDVMARAFDPFFTTKGVGKGTGLGLSQVFGFVRQSGGHIKCYSEVGHGTTFKIYLPRFFGGAPTPDTRRARARPQAAGRRGDLAEVVLVVEDEERLRIFTTEALRELGYTVVHAGDGAEALAMIDAGQGATLLFTDVVMPGMTGRQLADVAVERVPGLKVLYTTGYTRNAVVHNGTLDPGTNFLPKPFSVDQLAVKVREALDRE